MGKTRKNQTLGDASKGSKKPLSETNPGKKILKPKRTKTKVSIPENSVIKELPGISEATELPKNQTPAELPDDFKVSEIPREQTSAEELSGFPPVTEIPREQIPAGKLPGSFEISEISKEQTPADVLPGISEVTEIPREQIPAEELPRISNVTEIPKEQTDEKQHIEHEISNVIEIPKEQTDEKQHIEHSNEEMEIDESQLIENTNANKNNDLQLDQQDKERDAKQGISQTNLPKTGELGGVIFMCNTLTKPDCYRYMIMGFPDGRRDLVMKIRPEFKLFLFNYHEKVLYGIYKPASPGGMRIEPAAFNGSFPAQVRFRVDRDCSPLPLSALGEFSENLAGRVNMVKCELSTEEVLKLSAMFILNTHHPRSLDFNPNMQAGANAFVPPRPFLPGQMDPRAVAFNPNIQARANAIVPPRPFLPGQMDPRAMAFNPNLPAGANAIVPPRPFVPGQMDPRAMAFSPNIQPGANAIVPPRPFLPGNMDPRAMALYPNILAGGNAIVPPRPFVPGQTLPHQHLGGVPAHQIIQANSQHSVNAAISNFAPGFHQALPASQMDPRNPAALRPQIPANAHQVVRGLVPAPAQVAVSSPSLTDVALSNLSLLSASFRQAPKTQPQHRAPAPSLLPASHKQPLASAPSDTSGHDILKQGTAKLGSQHVPGDSQLVSSEDRRYSRTQVSLEAVQKRSEALYTPGSPRRKSVYPMAADRTEAFGHGREVELGDQITDRSKLDSLDRILMIPAAKAPSDYSRRQQKLGSSLDIDSLPVSSRYSFDGPSVKYR